jgi:hypothetical protein
MGTGPLGSRAGTVGHVLLAGGAGGMPGLVTPPRVLLGEPRRLLERLGNPPQDISEMFGVLPGAFLGGTDAVIGNPRPVALHRFAILSRRGQRDRHRPAGSQAIEGVR